eukprot:1933651-Rhodomonas_salina.3
MRGAVPNAQYSLVRDVRYPHSVRRFASSPPLGSFNVHQHRQSRDSMEAGAKEDAPSPVRGAAGTSSTAISAICYVKSGADARY